MAVTEHLGLELPDVAKNIDEEFYNFQLMVLPKIDQAIRLLSEALAQKALADHDHGIDGIEGLRNALDGKLAADVHFTLAGLSDVEGVDEAPDGYILVKVGTKMIAQAALAALGDHEHPISKVLGLENALGDIVEALTEKAAASAVGLALGEKLNKDASNVGDATAQAAFRASIGAISAADVPPVENLDADVITTGQFGAARIPNLDASKVNSGAFPEARLIAPVAGNTAYSMGGTLLLDQSGGFSGVKPSGTTNAWSAIRAGTVRMRATNGGSGTVSAHKNGVVVASASSSNSFSIDVSVVPGDVLTISGGGAASQNVGVYAASATTPAVVRIQ